jgi:hypothetical protein
MEFSNIFGKNKNRKYVKNNIGAALFDYKLTYSQTMEVQNERLDRQAKILFYFLNYN